MYHFFTETEFFTESEAVITGPDVNHIKNVLRMKPGEKILLSDGKAMGGRDPDTVARIAGRREPVLVPAQALAAAGT